MKDECKGLIYDADLKHSKQELGNIGIEYIYWPTFKSKKDLLEHSLKIPAIRIIIPFEE